MRPSTKPEMVSKFINDTLRRFGENQIMVVDLNARNIAWDKMTNERGTFLMEMVNKTPITQIVATDRPSYSKTLTKEEKENS